MRQRLLLPILMLFGCIHIAAAQSYNERVQAYISKYKDLAMAEQQRVGMPASVTLAQGILETQAGGSELATGANNHFGIKCKSNWTGETIFHDDDTKGECFRKYGTAYDSYKDHSDYLKGNARYASCFEQSVTDYAAWAQHLKKCGYATNPKYAPQLIKIIEENHLQQYTYAAIDATDLDTDVAEVIPDAKDVEVVSMPPAATAPKTAQAPAAQAKGSPPTHEGITTENGAKGFWAKKGDVLLQPAIRHKVRYAKLLQMNGLPDAPLAEDRFIYLEKAPENVRRAEVVQPVRTAAVPPAAPVYTASAMTTIAPDVAPARAPEERPAAKESIALSEEKSTPVNISGEVAVEELEEDEEDETELPAVTAAPKPASDFSSLKQKLDKMVYSEPAKPVPAVAKPAPVAPLPVSAPPAAVSAVPAYHTVQAGETAYAIARKNNIGVQQLMKLNDIKNFDAIRTGQKLRVR